MTTKALGWMLGNNRNAVAVNNPIQRALRMFSKPVTGQREISWDIRPTYRCPEQTDIALSNH